jgi:hypothetical protein
MNLRLSLLSVALPGLVGSGIAAADDAFAKDLKATIALQGLPCDQVVSSTRNKDSDYNAVCKDGNRYHVFVDGGGRVVVKKL